MLTVTPSDEKQSTCFKFIGSDSTPTRTNLISDNTSLISASPSECEDTCSFYSGPSDATIMAFGDGETCGSIALGGETCGSVAYSGGGETCGSIASSSVSFSGGGGGFSGGGCSYSC